jgi:hypothetical protein
MCEFACIGGNLLSLTNTRKDCLKRFLLLGQACLCVCVDD